MKRVRLLLTIKQLSTIEEALQMLELDYSEPIIGSGLTPAAMDVAKRIESIRKTIRRYEDKHEKDEI